MSVTTASLRRRISRSLVTILAISTLSTLTPFSTPVASAVIVTNGGCSIDGTNTSNFSLLDSITADGTCIVRFTSGSSSFVLPTQVDSIRTLAVGGGGGGGFGGNGGGGGAGAVISSTSGISVSSGATISATIGNGGLSPISKASPTDQAFWGQGAQGETTTLTIAGSAFSAVGGGGGGGSGNTDQRTSGVRGGSGGGSALNGPSAGAGFNIDYPFWTEAANAGFRSTSTSGGAGGGAGAAAINSNGAIGVTIFGYAIGGGGAGWSGGTNTTSGPFGGGAPRSGGGYLCTNDTCHGRVNTGGGGGGGGDGGSGVALVKFIPARGQGTISSTLATFSARGHTFVFTRTNAPSTGITRTFAWQVQASGSSTWSSVTGGSGASTETYTTGSLSTSDSNNLYRIAVTDTNSTLGISTTTYTSVSTSTVSNISTNENDTALTFNGTTQYAIAQDVPVFDLEASFTIQGWVYPTSVSGTRVILSKENSYRVSIVNGKYVFSFSTNATTPNWTFRPTSVPAVANEWHHFAVTRASGSTAMIFYLDGIRVDFADNITADADADALTGSIAPANSSLPLTIGASTTNGSTFTNFFAGEIDNIAAFDAVRTPAQILADSRDYISPTSTSLAYYYDFNEGADSTLFNRASASPVTGDLAVVGSPTWDDIKLVDPNSSPGYNIVTFSRSYITSIGGYRLPAEPRNYEALIVAGGGGGGSRLTEAAGGGGGGGGFVELAPRAFTISSVLSIRVGAGGLGAYVNSDATDGSGTNGLDSLISWGAGSNESVTAIGGGAGAGGTAVAATYAGRNGGSGGGGSGSNISYAGGQAIVPTGSGFIAFGFAGGNNYGQGSTNRPSGGGGGAGGAGESALSTTQSGAGGVGRQSAITTLFYSGGGGGGRSASSSLVLPGAGGNGGGGAGGNTTNFSGATNTGGGGGGSGADSAYRGAFGGSGIIVIKFLTTARPVFTAPTSDTTTAGLTHTFTVVGSAPAPLVRSYLWQSSSDTGSTWMAITVGTGLSTADYTTPMLETETSGSRYQYRVVVTDTDTAGTLLVETSTGVFLIINPRITITGTYTPVKYGNSRTDTFTVDSNTGTGTKTVQRTSPARTFVTWDTATANIARVTVGAQLTAGTYLDTLTVTDQKLATTILVVTITVLKADTVTVTVASRNDTYTASSLSYTDTFTVTGLVAGDSLTSVSYLYSGTANDGTSFTNAARPAIAGQYLISPIYTLVNFASYESVTVTSGTLTINRKLRLLTVTTSPTTLKYGDTSTVVATTADGAGDGSMSYQSSTTSLCQFSGAILQAIEASGNCQYTATIGRGNNFDTATSTVNTTTLALADTLTVTVLPITSVTYTGNQAVVTPRISISGFKLTDTTTATSASFGYRISSTTDSFTATVPTFSDTYTVRADTLTVTSGLLSRYRGITYVDGTLRINRALQTPLVLAQYSSIFGSPYRIISYGGSGVGAVIGSVSAGSASGCVTDGETVTTITEGSCLLTVTKAQDRNYETATVSALIYFLNWVAPVAPAPTTGPTIAITGENTVVVVARRAPVITSLGNSGDASFPVAIYGAGFQSLGAGITEVKFGRSLSVYSPDFIIVSDSLIKSRQPMGAPTAQIRVINDNGMAISQEAYIPFVVSSI
jgi:hypothetical protein